MRPHFGGWDSATAARRGTRNAKVLRLSPSPGRVIEPVIAPLETTVIVLDRRDLHPDAERRPARPVHPPFWRRRTSIGRRAPSTMPATASSRYFLSQLAVNASFGAVIGVGLWLIGIPSGALWGVLAGLLHSSPTRGRCWPPLDRWPLAAAIDPGWWSTISAPCSS